MLRSHDTNILNPLRENPRPEWWYPQPHKRGGGGGARFYRFTLNSVWTAGTANADILEMNGADTGIDADVSDPLGIFSTLGVDDPGICFLQDNVYYAIQAPCPLP